MVADQAVAAAHPVNGFVGHDDYPYHRCMSREEAEAEARRLSTEHPDRDSHHWLALERAGQWEVVKIALPPGKRIDPLTATVETEPEPPEPDDPRSPFERNIGGPWGPV